jgi:hypothetical protein
MIVGTEPPEQPETKARLKMAGLAAAAHVGKGSGAMFANNILEFFCDLIDGLRPGNPLKLIAHPLQRVFQTVGVVLMISDIHPFPADIAFTAGIGLISFYFDNPVVLNLHRQTTVLGAEDTAGMVNRSHKSSFLLIKI